MIGALSATGKEAVLTQPARLQHALLKETKNSTKTDASGLKRFDRQFTSSIVSNSKGKQASPG